MKYLVWSFVPFIAALSAGCAGSLDPNEDYYGNQLGASTRDAGAKKIEPKDAGGPEWKDSGASPPAANPASMSPAATAMNDDDDAGKTRVDDADGGGPAPVACDFRGLVMAKCGSSGCHLAPATATGLDLTSPSLATRVQGRMGTGACTDKLLIDKAHPEQSKLYLKVSGSACGVRMPLGGSLTGDEEACVLSWIQGL